MKLTLKIFLTGIAAAFTCSTVNAQIVYSNNFSLGAAININGTAPTLANAYAGGSSSAVWNSVTGTHDLNASLANGTVDTSQNTVLLPFSPQSGYIYKLIASVTFTSSPGSWVSMGFAGANPVNQTSARFADSSVNGIDWMIANPATANEQFFAGPKTTPAAGIGSQNLMNGLGTYTISVELDTMGPKWEISSFINGLQLGTNFTYSANPTIVAVGYGQNTLTSGSGVHWNSLDLLAETPEPSTLALTGLGLVGVYRFRRKQK
ncbi:MAG TPA: PEP-CTERM sorting domain-containing protein [Verrucomicrobiae bacterium]|jgi:hypothetical protein